MGSLLPRGDRAHCSSESKRKYKELVQNKSLFKTQASLFEFCATIGLRDEEFLEIKDRVQLVQSYSIDKEDALAMILLRNEPDLDPKGLLRRLEEYAEYGMTKLYRWIVDTGPRNTGDLPLVSWLKLEI